MGAVSDSRQIHGVMVPPLIENFRDLYNIAQMKKALVVDYWVFGEEQAGWNLKFTRNFNDWEIQPVLELLGRIEKFSLDAGKKDFLRWKDTKMEFS